MKVDYVRAPDEDVLHDVQWWLCWSIPENLLHGWWSCFHHELESLSLHSLLQNCSLTFPMFLVTLWAVCTGFQMSQAVFLRHLSFISNSISRTICVRSIVLLASMVIQASLSKTQHHWQLESLIYWLYSQWSLMPPTWLMITYDISHWGSPQDQTAFHNSSWGHPQGLQRQEMTIPNVNPGTTQTTPWAHSGITNIHNPPINYGWLIVFFPYHKSLIYKIIHNRGQSLSLLLAAPKSRLHRDRALERRHLSCPT